MGFFLVEAVLGTSVDKPSTVAVLGDAFDQEGVEVADALVVVRARGVNENNLPFGGEVVARWERVVAAVDLDDVTLLSLLPHNDDEAFSASWQLPLRLLQMVTEQVHQSCVHQVNRWLVPGISAFVVL